MSIVLKSKAFWGAVFAAVAHVLGASGNGQAAVIQATAEAVGGIISVVGLRTAVAKNGEGK